MPEDPEQQRAYESSGCSQPDENRAPSGFRIASALIAALGPVRDGAVQVLDEFSRQLETAVREAQAEGAIDPEEDAEQLAFELDAYLSLANTQFALSQESAPIDRARSALEERIKAAAPAA